MKNPIWWHQQNLCHLRAAIEAARGELEREQKRLGEQMARAQAEADALGEQIQRAIREKRDEFDADKFNVRKKKL
jgi:hypothetical protein